MPIMFHPNPYGGEVVTASSSPASTLTIENAERVRMPYEVYWMIDNQVLYVQLSGDVILDDIRESSTLISDELDIAYTTTPNKVVIGIIDVREANLDSIFRSALSMVVKQVADVIDPRIWKAKPGFSVLITGSERAKAVISLVIKISSQPMTSVATLIEAFKVTGAMYPELQDALEAYQSEHFPAGKSK